MEYEILIINLINAINDYDLEKTKIYVDLINNFKENQPSDIPLFVLLDIHRIDNYHYNNYCFDYVLDNLKNLGNDVDTVKWYRIRNKLIGEQNVNNIENFIINQLKEKSYNIPEKIFIQTLIQLSVLLNDREKTANILNQLLDKIKEVF